MYHTSTEGDPPDEYYKFRTQEKHILFVVFTPTILSQYEVTISTIFFINFNTKRRGIFSFTHCQGQSTGTFCLSRSELQHIFSTKKGLTIINKYAIHSINHTFVINYSLFKIV